MDSEHNANEDTKQREPQPPSPPPIPPDDANILRHTESRARNGSETAPEKFQKETRTIEWLQLITNAILVVIGIGALCIYGGQLKVMKGQLENMGGELTELKKSNLQSAWTT